MFASRGGYLWKDTLYIHSITLKRHETALVLTSFIDHYEPKIHRDDDATFATVLCGEKILYMNHIQFDTYWNFVQITNDID